MPLEDTLAFVEPIYLQAERSPMPELRLVVIATQDRLAYAARFPDALSQLLEGGGGTSASVRAGNAATPTIPATAPNSEIATPVESTDLRVLVQRANQALADYRKLTSEGKLGDAGAKLDELKRVLEEMNRAPQQHQ
jgi:uncharacterized membrane protein (UPF0182 family)